jgi:hypothetical protein
MPESDPQASPRPLDEVLEADFSTDVTSAGDIVLGPKVE